MTLVPGGTVSAAGRNWKSAISTRASCVAAAYASVERGFNVILWRAGDLGNALVSDVDARDLRELAARFARG